MENNDRIYRFMMIGAHPDDMELRCGGLALRLREAGHRVCFLSLTDGSAGHHLMDRETLKERRRNEAESAARLLDVEYGILDYPDGELEPTLAARKDLICRIRAFAPHVILTHRTNDYHPDHRAAGRLVMDCAYMVNVPLVCPEAPAMAFAPVILSVWDPFTKPQPFHPDVAVPYDAWAEKKMQAVLCHVSQLYEWLPHVDGWEDVENASSHEEKTALIRQRLDRQFRQDAVLYPDRVPPGTLYAETFEWNEYGGRLTEDVRKVMEGQ